MADENGSGNGVDLRASPSEFATFRIGGRDLKVSPMTLWDLEESRADIQEMGPDTPWTQYAAKVVRIVARKLQPLAWESFAEGLLKSCSAGEARNLVSSFNDLWRLSGLVGEAEAVEEETPILPGIGTSTESPPNSP